MTICLEDIVETPENVPLSRELAGPAYRGLAYLIDLALRLMILVAAMFVLIFAAVVLPGVAIGTMLLAIFLLEWGYTIGFESLCHGRTPGKMLCGLRVVHETGQPLSWWGAVLRNLVRVGDMIPFLLIYGEGAGGLLLLPVYGPGFIAMIVSGRMQRLGDLAARTVVVHDRAATLPRAPVIYDRVQPLPLSDVNGFVPRSGTLALIDEFLARRSVLTYDRGHLLAGELARTLAAALDYKADRQLVHRYPMAFLARVYVTYAAERSSDPAKGSAPSPTSRPRKEAVV